MGGVADAMEAVAGPVATTPKDDVWLGTAVLASAAAEASVRDDRAGAVSVFVGTTRGTFQGKVVVRLEYEAYEAMAAKQLAALCRTVRAQHPDVLHLAVHHRLGVVAVGEASVVIAVSSAHRREAIGRFGGRRSVGERGTAVGIAGVGRVLCGPLCCAVAALLCGVGPSSLAPSLSPLSAVAVTPFISLFRGDCPPSPPPPPPFPGTEACHFAIDELKATVPIWKREVYADGSTWKANCECTVSAHRAGQAPGAPASAPA